MVTDENVRRLEEIHSSEAAAAAAAEPHLSVTPASRDHDWDATQVKTNTGVAADDKGVSSWTCDDVTRWLADNQLLALRNW